MLQPEDTSSTQAAATTGLLTRLALDAPRLTVAFIVLLTVVSAFWARSIRIDSSIDALLPAHDPARAYYDEVRRVFGNEDFTVIGVFARDVFAPSTLARIDALTQQLAAIDGVRKAVSLSTVEGIEVGDLGLHVGKLMRALPQTPAQAAAFRARVTASPFQARNLVAPDATATAVLVLLNVHAGSRSAEETEGRIRQVVASLDGPETYALSGIQTIQMAGARLMERDLGRFVPLAIVIVVIVLACAFRTLRGVLIPLTTVLIGVIWTTGLMVVTGSAITLSTLVLPPLLMAIGVAYAIHIVSQYYQEARPDRSVRAAVQATQEKIQLPVVVAAVTTLLGFATLILSPISGISQFGWYASFGIAAIAALSLTFVPATLVLLPRPRPGTNSAHSGRWMAVLLETLGHTAMQHRGWILTIAAVVSLFCLWGATRIRVETDYLTFFHRDSQVRRDNDRIARHLGGALPIYIVIDGDGPKSITRLDMLAAIDDLQAFVAAQTGVDSSISFVDYLALARSALNPDAAGRLPQTRAEVAQLLQFVDPDELRPVVNRDFSRANVIVRTTLSGSTSVGKFVRRVNDFAQRRFRTGVRVHVTGTIVLLNHSADTLARGQIAGLVQMLAVLLILMSLLFLSLRVGLLSLVPNVFPILILFGLMGWSGITLNISTSMIAVIAVGIAVDDTIHYLNALNAEIRHSGDQGEAVRQVGRTVGRPIVFTSIALSAGFLVVCLSSFGPIRNFGILASATLATALFADLLLTPAIATTTTIITLWDLMYVKLGPNPHQEIPLFAGLRPLQARIVVLMARLTSASPGAYITRTGELKEELYVLLKGCAHVRRPGTERVIAELGRGDVIGEMGLVRHRPRSADVVSAQETEYLVLDPVFLDRIQRRYPRIAARVFLNLTRILSDRLETTTDQLVDDRT